MARSPEGILVYCVHFLVHLTKPRLSTRPCACTRVTVLRPACLLFFAHEGAHHAQICSRLFLMLHLLCVRNLELRPRDKRVQVGEDSLVCAGMCWMHFSIGLVEHVAA